MNSASRSVELYGRRFTHQVSCRAAAHSHRSMLLSVVQCKVAQPKDLPEPTVTCPSCQHVTTVPSSNAKKHARESAQKTKEFAAQTAAATKAGIEHLRATPTTFRQPSCIMRALISARDMLGFDVCRSVCLHFRLRSLRHSPRCPDGRVGVPDVHVFERGERAGLQAVRTEEVRAEGDLRRGSSTRHQQRSTDYVTSGQRD
jgi:uncharacterized Zn finger protein (UPF0148 family)